MRSALPRTRLRTLIRSRDSGRRMQLLARSLKRTLQVLEASQLQVVAVVAALSNSEVLHLKVLLVEEELADEQTPDITD